MKILNSREFMKKNNLKNDTTNESHLQKVYNYPIYPRDSKTNSDKALVNIDNGSVNGTHWTCFIIRENEPYYFDSFGGQPDNFLLNQLHKLIINHNYTIQDINSKLCRSYCLYVFCLIERMNYYDSILKINFLNSNNANKCISK